MRVVAATVHTVDLPLREPFVIAYARYDVMPVVILELTTDTGLTGWGEAVPDPNVTGELQGGVVAALTDLLLPAVLGTDPCDIEAAHEAMDAALHANPAAKAAVDIALHDLLGKATGQPIHRLVGGTVGEVPTYPRVLSIGDPERMAQQADEAVGKGYASIKVKVGSGGPDADVPRIQAVCEAVAGRVPVRVDVNQGWGTPGVAIPAIRRLEGLGLSWVEQPVLAHDIAGLAEVRRASAVPIMADEAVHGLVSLLEVIRLRAADVVNIKLMKTGGIHPALQLASLAKAAGLGAQVGSMVESSIGSAAGYHVATARAGITSTELTGPLLFTRDLGNLRYELPNVLLGDGPGLGVEVDRDALADLSTTSVDLTHDG